jgi:hypothetical protein
MNKNIETNIKMTEKPLDIFKGMLVKRKRLELYKFIGSISDKIHKATKQKFINDITRAKQNKLIDIYTTLQKIKESDTKKKHTYKELITVTKQRLVRDKEDKSATKVQRTFTNRIVFTKPKLVRATMKNKVQTYRIELTGIADKHTLNYEGVIQKAWHQTLKTSGFSGKNYTVYASSKASVAFYSR